VNLGEKLLCHLVSEDFVDILVIDLLPVIGIVRYQNTQDTQQGVKYGTPYE
jgi:hypothetical protein